MPVRLIRAAFLVLLAIVTAEATQAVGALLLLGLIAALAGAAHQLTTQPLHGIALSGAFAVLVMWAELALIFAIPSLPPSTAIIAVAAGTYLLTGLTRRARLRSG